MMKNSDILISKSRYMAGLRCDKLLWCTYHQKELFPPYGKATATSTAFHVEIPGQKKISVIR